MNLSIFIRKRTRNPIFQFKLKVIQQWIDWPSYIIRAMYCSFCRDLPRKRGRWAGGAKAKENKEKLKGGIKNKRDLFYKFRTSIGTVYLLQLVCQLVLF